jgi:hypothetical protein
MYTVVVELAAVHIDMHFRYKEHTVYFLFAILMPSVRKHPDKKELLHKIGLNFMKAGWTSLGLLLATGIINLSYRGISWTTFLHEPGLSIYRYKVLLFLLIVTLSFFHDFIIGPKGIKEINNNSEKKIFVIAARYMGRINLVLALIILYYAIVIVRGS